VQSRLIESLLIRIPLPAFYFDATDENRWLVVDGLQRLTAIRGFALDKTLKLQGLEFLSDCVGLGYDDLSRGFQRRITETQVTVYQIEQGTPPEVKFNIFKRINTGGLPLSPQEIRHALYQGYATDLLAKLASSVEFQRATNNGIRDDRMADRECVLRFLAFILTPYQQYRASELDGFLNDAMVRLNALSAGELQGLESQFAISMRAATSIFGVHAFRKQTEPYPNARLNPISKALFEAWAVGLAQRSREDLAILIERRERLNNAFRATLREDQPFLNAITQGTGDVGKVRKRFATIEQIIAEALQ